jgi:DHA1 family bicyclomycin/chloramphenicol resistance-like MFS transporter
VIGAFLQEEFGWRSTFAFTAIFGAVLLLTYSTIFSETNNQRLTRLDIAALKKGYREVASSRRFLQPVLTSSLSLASWYTFFAAAPALFIEQFGMTPSEFGLIISTQVTGFVGATILTGRKAALWGEDRLIGVGRLLSVAGVTSVGLVALAGNLSPYTILPSMIVYSAGSGLLFPLLTAAALRPFSHIAGTASSAFIATFQVICAIGTVAASLSASLAPEAFIPVMLAAQCLSVMAHWLLRSPAETLTGRGMR